MELEAIMNAITTIGFPMVVWWVCNRQMVALQDKLIELQNRCNDTIHQITIAVNNNTRAIEYLGGVDNVDSDTGYTSERNMD